MWTGWRKLFLCQVGSLLTLLDMHIDFNNIKNTVSAMSIFYSAQSTNFSHNWRKIIFTLILLPVHLLFCLFTIYIDLSQYILFISIYTEPCQLPHLLFQSTCFFTVCTDTHPRIFIHSICRSPHTRRLCSLSVQTLTFLLPSPNRQFLVFVVVWQYIENPRLTWTSKDKWWMFIHCYQSYLCVITNKNFQRSKWCSAWV